MSAQIQLTCPKHREYKAVRKPKVDCRICWTMYSTIRALASTGTGIVVMRDGRHVEVQT